MMQYNYNIFCFIFHAEKRIKFGSVRSEGLTPLQKQNVLYLMLFNLTFLYSGRKNVNAATVSALMLWEVNSMRKYNTFAELESLLLTAINLPGATIKSIAAATGIQANTLYKWKISPIHLLPEKADRYIAIFHGV